MRRLARMPRDEVKGDMASPDGVATVLSTPLRTRACAVPVERLRNSGVDIRSASSHVDMGVS